MRALIVEDDPHIRRGIVEVLASEGYEAVEAADGAVALALFDSRRPDFVCLDIMMPGLSGYDVCREIRRRDVQIPILFVSAKSEEIDRVLGLELGADDFIVKPFGVRELVARIRAITRRCLANRPPPEEPATFFMGDLEVLTSQLRARRGDRAIELSLRDIKILQLLHRERGRVVSRDTLYDHAWGLNHIASSRAVDQHVSQLRKRIEVDPAEPLLIRTVHGAGYRFE